MIHNGIKSRYNCFNVYSRINSNEYDRSAVIVSKKIGNAIKRNYIKRIIRETIRNKYIANPPYFDFVIQPLPGIGKENKEDIALCIEKIKKTQRKKLEL